jgi:hypothetical protein
MDIYGEPSLVGTGDMSLTGWKTEDGNYVADNQRSQMVLVATKPTAAESDEMVDGAANAAGVDSSKVLSSATFNLDLNICSKYTEIPAGSYMKLAFGFPEGFGPEDEGVTFQVYHFKKNSDGSLNYDEPEILDCVITEYGLIVTVTSFSPFAIIAVNKSDVPASTTRNIYAESLSTGGTLVADSQGIIKVSQGATKTFTFVPADGYQVDRVLLNE